jgi:hypothetical protein
MTPACPERRWSGREPLAHAQPYLFAQGRLGVPCLDGAAFAGIDRLFLLSKPFDFRPELLEAFLPHQFLKLATIASIRVQFLDDDPAQCIEAILAAALSCSCFRRHIGGSRQQGR